MGVKLTTMVDELQREAAENKQQHAHIYEAIDKLRNRLPAWATMLIAALTAIIGLLGGLAL